MLCNCKICGGENRLLGAVPFDRNNAGVPIVDSTPMEYYQCTVCDAVSCPEMLSWSPNDLGDRVYNSDYVKYDPDYLGVRPKNNANTLIELFKHKRNKFSHLDYGSGEGILSKELIKYNKWNSESYDPYSNNTRPVSKYDFITSFEVFEHSLDVDATIKDIKSFLKRDGVILFSTLFATPNTNIDWWYIGARNGHINILSEKSMKILAIKNNMYINSISQGLHVLQPTRNSLKNLLEGRSIW